MRKVSRAVYLIAAVVSIALYASGLFTGLFIQKSATQLTEERLASIQTDLENTQLEYIYLNTLGQSIPCSSLASLMDESTEKVWSIGKNLTQLEKANSDTQKVEELTQNYYLLSVRAWILSSYVNEKCNQGRTVILYFYSVPCKYCEQQGAIFDQLKAEGLDSKLMVFVLNLYSNEPIVDVLSRTYNVTSTPSLVIGNHVYSGLVGRDTLKSMIS